MNGLINCYNQEVILVHYPSFDSFCRDLQDSGFVVETKFSSLTKGYVSRVRGREPLFIGWSPRLRLWYVLSPNYLSKQYCYRDYFTIYDSIIDCPVCGDTEDGRHVLSMFEFPD